MKINYFDKKQNSIRIKKILVVFGGLLVLGIIFSIIQVTTAAPDWPTVGHPWIDMQCDTNMCVNSLTGRVGIGINSPASKFHVKDGQTWGSDLSIDATGTTGGRRWLLIATGGNAGEGQGKFLIKDNNANASRIIIDSSGQVGIGANSPGYNLDVSGTGRFTGALTLDTQASLTSHAVNAGRTITAGNGLTGGGDLTQNRTLTVGAGTGITVGASSVGLTYPTKSCSSGYAIRSFDLGSSYAPTCVAVGLPTGSSGQTLRYGTSWEASSIIHNDGTNVGIGGTPASGRKLHVHGTMRLTSHFYDVNDSSGSNDQVLTRTTYGPAWQTPSSGGGTLSCTTVLSNWVDGASVSANCPSGYPIVTGGGCQAWSDYRTIYIFQPNEDTGGSYDCARGRCIAAGCDGRIMAIARCCRID